MSYYGFGVTVDKECSICSRNTGNKGYRKCKNQHRFHKTCLERWFDAGRGKANHHCPNCRTKMNDLRKKYVSESEDSEREGSESESEESDFDPNRTVYNNEYDDMDSMLDERRDELLSHGYRGDVEFKVPGIAGIIYYYKNNNRVYSSRDMDEEMNLAEFIRLLNRSNLIY